MFDFILKPIGSYLAWLDSWTGSYMIALLIFAITIEILLLPLGIKQQKTSIKQAKLRPKEMAIQKKYAGRNDKVTMQKMQQEIMELRQKEVNVFMLYGLISVDERGLWYYTLGDRNYNIISKLQVTTDNSIAHLSKYMELVIYKRFYELEKINEHLTRIGC